MKFNSFQEILIKHIELKRVAWGISQAAFDELKLLHDAWKPIWIAYVDPTIRTETVTRTKNKARKKLEKAIRQFVKQWLAFNAKVSDTNRVGMSLTVRDKTNTRVNQPKITPGINVREIQHLIHILSIRHPSTPDSKAKPKGIRAVQIFMSVSEKQPKLKDYRFVGNATRHLYRVNHNPQNKGETAWYIARYENTRGETGTWSMHRRAVIA